MSARRFVDLGGPRSTTWFEINADGPAMRWLSSRADQSVFVGVPGVHGNQEEGIHCEDCCEEGRIHQHVDRCEGAINRGVQSKNGRRCRQKGRFCGEVDSEEGGHVRAISADENFVPSEVVDRFLCA